MATPTYLELSANDMAVLQRIRDCLAILASGQNPDGSTNSAGGLTQAQLEASLVKLEDAVAASGDKLVPIAAVRKDAIGANAADGDYVTLLVDAIGRLKTTGPVSATGTQSSVAHTGANATYLAANSARIGATIFNDDTAVTGATLKLKLGQTASASSFSVIIQPQGYYEVPFGYTGIIDGISSAATGNARITELT